MAPRPPGAVGVSDAHFHPGQAGPELGWRAGSLRYIKIPLTAARDHQRLDLAGSVLCAYGSSSPVAYARIGIGGEDNRDEIVVRDGFQLEGVPFSRLTLSHPAQPDQFLGLITANPKPMPRFRLEAPPPLTAETLFQSGFGFGHRSFQSGVAAEFSTIVIINNTTDTVGFMVQLAIGVGQLGVVDLSNAALAADLGTQRTPANVIGSWRTGDAAGERTAQLEYHRGTTLVNMTDGEIFGDTNLPEIQIGKHTGAFPSMVPILPGHHIAAQDPNANTSHTVSWLHCEAPLDLWEG